MRCSFDHYSDSRVNKNTGGAGRDRKDERWERREKEV